MHSDNPALNGSNTNANKKTNSTDQRPESLAIQLDEKGLFLSLSTGVCYFNYYWLRDACSSNIDPATRERVFDISGLPCAPYPAAVNLQNDKLIIDWRDEQHQSALSLSMLDEFTANGGRIPDVADIPRRPWYADGYTKFERLKQHDIETDDTEKQRFARALIENGVALVTDMQNSDDSLTRLATSLGPVTPVVDGYYFDVRLSINPTNLAYTANALELHTDLPNEEAAPGVQFLHCRANDVSGGLSLFVDGTAVAETLRNEEPEYFNLLSQHDIPFYRRHTTWDYRAHQRVIELDAAGNVSGLTISQHLQDSMDLPQNLLDDYYPALCHFLRMLQEDRFVSRFRLAAGECVVFDNHRVVHGREAFVATEGERHLRGCYVDRGALRSTYRTLCKQ